VLVLPSDILVLCCVYWRATQVAFRYFLLSLNDDDDDMYLLTYAFIIDVRLWANYGVSYFSNIVSAILLLFFVDRCHVL